MHYPLCYGERARSIRLRIAHIRYALPHECAPQEAPRKTAICAFRRVAYPHRLWIRFAAYAPLSQCGNDTGYCVGADILGQETPAGLAVFKIPGIGTEPERLNR